MSAQARALSIKRLFFCAVLLSPMLVSGAAIWYLIAGTSLVQEVYLRSGRNLDMLCMRWTGDGYGYKAQPGPCSLNNLEYRTTLTFDGEGYRNADTRAPADVVLLGDSHTLGFGVQDDQTAAAILQQRYQRRVRNLGMSSYATQRELEAFRAYGRDARVVVLQYCDNDGDENRKSLALSDEEFLQQVHERWLMARERYAQRKARGPAGVVADFAQALLGGKFKSRRSFEASYRLRNMRSEASSFASTLAKYRQDLEGRTIIVFESSGHGQNHPDFKAAVDAALAEHAPGLSVTVLDTHRLLQRSDYYRIDDHLNPQGHARMAQLLDPLIRSALGEAPR